MSLARDLSQPTLLSRSRIQNIGVRSKDTYTAGTSAHFVSFDDFMSRIDEMSATQCSWVEHVLSDATGQHEFSRGVKFWTRDTLAVLQEMLDNPNLADKCKWAPEKIVNADGDRVYTDLYDSEWWWRTQVIVQVLCTNVSGTHFWTSAQ
jgi:hypothetical protein